MNAASDVNDIPESAPPDPDEVLEPTEAAKLLEATQQRARRQLAQQTPLLSILTAALVLGVYGSIWLSVRGQHPYVGPSLAVIGIVYLAVAVFAVIAARFQYKARAGVSGRSRREERIRAIPGVVALVGIYTFMGALKYDGFSNAVVYGVVDAAGPWLIGGAVLAGWAAAKEDWWKLGAGVGLVVVGTASAFFGPENVWGILGIVGCLAAIGHAAMLMMWARRG